MIMISLRKLLHLQDKTAQVKDGNITFIWIKNEAIIQWRDNGKNNSNYGYGVLVGLYTSYPSGPNSKKRYMGGRMGGLLEFY